MPCTQDHAPGSVSSIRDVDKNGFILNSDFIAIRQGIVGGLVLRNITIPASGSGAALPRVGSGGGGEVIENAVARVQILDDIFADLDRQFKRKR